MLLHVEETRLKPEEKFAVTKQHLCWSVCVGFQDISQETNVDFMLLNEQCMIMLHESCGARVCVCECKRVREIERQGLPASRQHFQFTLTLTLRT